MNLLEVIRKRSIPHRGSGTNLNAPQLSALVGVPLATDPRGSKPISLKRVGDRDGDHKHAYPIRFDKRNPPKGARKFKAR